MAKGVTFSRNDAQRIADAVRLSEASYRNDADEITRARVMAPIIQFVKLSSLTQTAGRYPGNWCLFDAAAGTFSDQDAIWIVHPNGATPELATYYLARSSGFENSRPVFVLEIFAGGGSSSGGMPIDARSASFTVGGTGDIDGDAFVPCTIGASSITATLDTTADFANGQQVVIFLASKTSGGTNRVVVSAANGIYGDDGASTTTIYLYEVGDWVHLYQATNATWGTRWFLMADGRRPHFCKVTGGGVSNLTGGFMPLGNGLSGVAAFQTAVTNNWNLASAGTTFTTVVVRRPGIYLAEGDIIWNYDNAIGRREAVIRHTAAGTGIVTQVAKSVMLGAGDGTNNYATSQPLTGSIAAVESDSFFINLRQTSGGTITPSTTMTVRWTGRM